MKTTSFHSHERLPRYFHISAVSIVLLMRPAIKTRLTGLARRRVKMPSCGSIRMLHPDRVQEDARACSGTEILLPWKPFLYGEKSFRKHQPLALSPRDSRRLVCLVRISFFSDRREFRYRTWRNESDRRHAAL